MNCNLIMQCQCNGNSLMSNIQTKLNIGHRHRHTHTDTHTTTPNQTAQLNKQQDLLKSILIHYPWGVMPLSLLLACMCVGACACVHIYIGRGGGGLDHPASVLRSSKPPIGGDYAVDRTGRQNSRWHFLQIGRAHV